MAQDVPFALAIHGGAGVYDAPTMSAEDKAAAKASLDAALKAGEAVLAAGGSALDAVQAAVQVMEDDPRFNAGRGAVLTHDGTVELDASIMEGATLKAGSVARLSTTRHPVAAARAVMDRSDHVLLSGRDADGFAADAGLEQVTNAWFITDKRREQLKKAQGSAEHARQYKLGTVGAVARDRKGLLAAATSTGGMTNKRYGRIGDSPIIGAGTYADNASCAVSATGWGEFFIRATVARSLCALVEYRRMGIAKAARTVLDKVAAMGGDGGVIVIDPKGRIAMDYNTPGMFRGSVVEGGKRQTFITRSE